MVKYIDERKIRNLRITSNINQIELFNLLYVTKQCVIKWKNDNVLPPVEMLSKLAKLFNAGTDYLLGLDSDNVIDVVGLINSKIAHIKLLVDNLKTSHKE